MNQAIKMLLAILIGLPAAALCQNAHPAADYPIGKSDLLEIHVLGVDDFSREVRVTASGTIRLPFLGEIQVLGLMPGQLETKLVGLLAPDYVKNPQVSVMIKEPLSRTFSMVGAVMKPGQFQLLQPITLVSAIAWAGGVNLAKAGDLVLIQRSAAFGDAPAAPGAAGEERADASYQIRVDLKKLLREGDLTRNLTIMPGDIISIPEREPTAIYVVGDVNRPGPFEFPDQQGIKLSRALALAGGPTKTSRLGQTALMRLQANGSVQRIALNLDRVLKGKDPDIELQPNDLVYVPGSVQKTLGWGVLGAAPYVLMRLLIPW